MEIFKYFNVKYFIVHPVHNKMLILWSVLAANYFCHEWH